MTEFNKDYYRNFEDPNGVMQELFGITCSLCGYEEISYVTENAPDTLGVVAKNALAKNPAMTDEEMDALMDGPIDAWQQVDDYNSEQGIPTFLCFDCYEQLSNGDIKVSDLTIGGE